MANEHILWKPSLLTAQTVGFKADEETNVVPNSSMEASIHIRWMIDSRFGMPVKIDDAFRGKFTVYAQQKGWPSLRAIDLFNPPGPIGLRPDGIESNEALLEEDTDRIIRFFKKREGSFHRVTFALRQSIQALRSSTEDWSDEDKAFMNYLHDLSPGLSDGVPGQDKEQVDVCGVDLHFRRGRGRTPVDPAEANQPAGCGAVLNAFINRQEYARVKAYNRAGQVVDEDWIGRESFLFRAARTHYKISLRGEDIHTVRIEANANRPVMELADARWLSCQDYSRSNIWDLFHTEEMAFDLNPENYDANRIQGLLRPYQNEGGGALLQPLQEFLNPQGYLKELIEADNTYAQYTASYASDVDTDPELQGFAMPVLAGLMGSTIDPLMARLLALHVITPRYTPDKGGDVKIEAEFPFFEPENLEILSNRLTGLMNRAGLNGNGDFLRDLANTGEGRLPVISALALQTDLKDQPQPHLPNPVEVEPDLRALPTQEDINDLELLLNTRMRWRDPENVQPPFIYPVAFEVERDLGGEGFVNALRTSEPSPVEGLGVLPAVFLPSRWTEADFGEPDFGWQTIRDMLRIADVGEEESIPLTYRIRSFDFYGRHSDWMPLDPIDLTVPCTPPEDLLYTSADVLENGKKVSLIYPFSFLKQQRDMQATSERLELTFWRSSYAPDGEDPIVVNGRIPAMKISVGYRTENGAQVLDLNNITTSCISVLPDEDGNLNPQNAAEESCLPEFRPNTVSMEARVVNRPPAPEGQEEVELADYQLELEILNLDQTEVHPSGFYQWTMHAVIQGTCASGNEVPSIGQSNQVEYRVPPPLPDVVQPPLETIPESTYPDRLGKSYYDLALRPFFPVNERTGEITPIAEPLFRLYHTTLDRLLEKANSNVDIHTLVNGTTMTQENWQNILELASNTRRAFVPLFDQPPMLTRDYRFHAVEAVGDRELYHIVGIIGTNTTLLEKPWKRAAFYMFKTPVPAPVPMLFFKQANLIDGAALELVYGSNIRSEVEENGLLPKVQVMREDLITGISRFAGEAAGTFVDEEIGYQFSFLDQQAAAGRRHTYRASLMVESMKSRGDYIKSKQPVENNYALPFPASYDPLGGELNALISPMDDGGFRVAFSLPLGEYDFLLQKVLENKDAILYHGSIENGALRGELSGTLQLDQEQQTFELELDDPDQNEGEYTLRMQTSSKRVWSKKLNNHE